MRYFLVFFLIILMFSLNLHSQALFQPSNLNFEQSTEGMIPYSWNHSLKLEEAGMIVETSIVNPAEGKFCVLLFNPSTSINREEVEKSTLPTYQVLDAIPFRGKTVKLTAKARLDSASIYTKGELWAIGRSTKENITLDIYQEKGIEDPNWKTYTLSFFVPEETNELRIGILIKGGGKLYADDFNLEIVQPDGAVNEPTKNYTSSEITNLKSLANIYGYLNYFNPATNMNSSRNDELTFWALANVEKAKNHKELFEVLKKYTELLSPASKLSFKALENDDYHRPEGCLDYVAYAKKYVGGPVDRPDEIFSESTVNVFATTRSREASVVQMIDALKYKSKTAKISVSIKVEQASPGANAQIWARADRIGSRDFIAATTADSPAMTNAWKRYDLMIELPQDIFTIKLALVFLGEGKAYFDDVKIDIIEKGKKIDEINIPNNSFEINKDSSIVPDFWLVDPAVFKAGYFVKIDDRESSKGQYSLVIESEKENRIAYPKIGSLTNYMISENMYLHHASILYGDEKSVLPKAKSDSVFTKGKPSGFNPTPEDRFTRVASVIKLWNAIKHFGPVRNDAQKLDSALEFSLLKAGRDKNNDEFFQTIKSLLLLTNDARAMVWYPDVDFSYTFPFIFRDFKGKILVTAVIDSSIGVNIGDQIIKYDDETITDLIKNKVIYIPGNNNKYKISKALVEIRAGLKGSSSKITLQRKDGSLFDVLTTRNTLLNNIFEPRPIALHEIDSTIAYIDLTVLSDDVIKEYIEAIAKRKAYIFDLRGYSKASEHLLSMLSKDSVLNSKWEVPVYTFPDGENQSTLNYGGQSLQSNGQLAGKKSFFLIDDKTTGYAEALASVVKENKLGVLIGSATSGYASESMAFRLLGQIGVSFAGLNVIAPDNTIIFGNSIQPDIELDYNINESNGKYDNYILKAIELLRN